MLVLSRLKNEEVCIRASGIEITVKIVDLKGDKVRLGIQAPEEVTIHRREVQELIDAEVDRLKQDQAA